MSDVLTVPASEVAKNFGRYQDEALKHPVEVTSNGRPKTMIVAVDEWKRLKRRDRQAFKIEEMGADFFELLASAEPPPEAALFDDEV